MTGAGDLLITARRFRTQEANRADARARLVDLLAKAHERPIKRRPNQPSRAAKARPVDAKKNRSSIKAARGRVRMATGGPGRGWAAPCVRNNRFRREKNR